MMARCSCSSALELGRISLVANGDSWDEEMGRDPSLRLSFPDSAINAVQGDNFRSVSIVIFITRSPASAQWFVGTGHTDKANLSSFPLLTPPPDGLSLRSAVSN